MDDIRAEFKQWLQEKYSANTIKQYFLKIDKICKDLYGYCDWNRFSEDAYYCLARYAEYANKEYFVDIVTICYALNYFDNIFEIIKYPTLHTYKIKNVKLYLYSNKSNYFIDVVPFDELYYYLVILNHLLYNRNINYKQTPVFVEEFIQKVDRLIKENCILDKTKIAIHIKYIPKSATEKVALSKYCIFLQHSLPQNASVSKLMKTIKSKNPNKTIHGHYKIVQQISGYKPLVIKATNEAERLDINFTLTKVDLCKIFNLNMATINKLLQKEKWINNATVTYEDEDYEFIDKIAKKILKRNIIIGYETELRKYYSVEDINEYLDHGHTYNHHKKVNYTKKGYKYWKNCKETLKILGIGKTSFYKYVYNENNPIPITYLAYTPYTTKYYLPELDSIKLIIKNNK